MPFKTIALALSIITIELITPGCKKKKNPGPAYTAQLGRIRNWQRHRHFEYLSPDLTYIDSALADTSFAVAVIDDRAISVLGETLNYAKTDSASHAHFFSAVNKEGGIDQICYYYSQDIIIYDHYVTHTDFNLEDRYQSN